LWHIGQANSIAIVRACEDKPDYLIETSTLTGAQTVALGARTLKAWRVAA